MEDLHVGYRLFLLMVIVGFNAFFASAEVALLSVRPTRLREMVAAGHVGAQAALSLRARPQRLLSVTQVGVTLASLGAGWAGEETIYWLLLKLFHPLITHATEPFIRVFSFALAFLVLTFVMVVIGEVVPKNLAIDKVDRFSVLVAPVLLVFYRILEPFVYVLERSASAVGKLLGVRGEQRGSYSLEELKVIVESSRQAGYLPEFDAEVIRRVLEIEDLTVRQIMVPRTEISSVPVDASLDQILRLMVEYKFTRVPVYENTPENIIGLLHYKDMLRVFEDWRVSQQVHRPVAPFRIRKWLKKIIVVPETKPVSQMLKEFRRDHIHMACVVDEFGTIVGLITLEDVLEQVVGEIEDEYDIRRHAIVAGATTLDLDGTTSIRDLEMEYGIELPTDAGFETLAGFLLAALGHIPKAGEVAEYEGRRFTILEMDRKRIARVRIAKLPQQSAKGGSDLNDEHSEKELPRSPNESERDESET